MSASTVVAAVRRDLKLIRDRSPEIADSALAASALVLAKQLDDTKTSATSKSMCARALLEVMDRLFELTPAPDQKDGVDDLSTRRAARLGRATA